MEDQILLSYARLRPGRGFRPGRALLYYAQRLVVQSASRRTIARLIAAGIRRSHPPGVLAGEPEGTPRSTAVLEQLRRDGCSELGALLSPAALAEIHRFLAKRAVRAADGRSFAADRPPAGVPLGAYALEDVLQCPHLLALANAPALTAVVGAYLGCQPTLSSLGLRWSFPPAAPGGSADTQRFHRDPDDGRVLKLLVYLTDVDAGAGPHCFVAGSHRSSGRVFARPYRRDQLAARYGAAAIRDFTGPAGSALLADTYGIHRGGVPSTRPRLAFLAQYSLLPIFAFEYHPVRLARPPAVDRYVNRLLLA
ncbi:MAG: phytanoyl-CoA dioxygenase family protein [Dongiaceae bacterium]